MDGKSQQDFELRSQSASSSDRSEIVDPLTSSLGNGGSTILKHESGDVAEHNVVAPVTSTDVKRLLGNSRAMCSDLSILRGEFSYTHATESSVKALNDNRVQLPTITEFENGVFRLLKKIEKRELASTNDGTPTPATNSGDDKDLQAMLSAEHKKLNELYTEYSEMRDNIEALRVKLENNSKGEYGVHDYDIDIKYQIIGNQTLPVYYKKPKTKVKKRTYPAQPESSPLQSSTPSTPYTPVPATKKLKAGTGNVGRAKPVTPAPKKLTSGDNTGGKVEGKSKEMIELEAELARMKKEKALLSIEVNALKAEKKILQS